MSQKIRVVTRKSKLALIQTNLAIKTILKKFPEAEFEIIEVLSDGCYERFKGDLASADGKGMFTKSLSKMVQDGKADMAVHSMKDVPTDEDLLEGLTIAAVLPRNDRRDVAICKKGQTFVGLKEGSTIGTSSIRRAAQIRAHFPHLEVVPMRGNVGTRIQKMEDGEVDALVLAKAGIDLLDKQDVISDVFEPDMLMPALSQGIIGIECRKDNKYVMDILAETNHKDTYTCLMAERALLKELKADCYTPIGGYCEITKGGNLRMLALVAAEDGKKVIRGREKLEYNKGKELAKAVAKQLLEQGAGDYIGKK